MDITERFINYTKFDTQSAEDSETVPSTSKQLIFAKYLKEELEAEGLKDVEMDDKGYIYAHDVPGAVATQEYLPEELRGREYYHPTDRGYEREVGSRMERIRAILHGNKSSHAHSGDGNSSNTSSKRSDAHNGDGHSANTQARNSSDVKSVDKQSRQSQSARTEHKDKETTVNEKTVSEANQSNNKSTNNQAETNK